ncbi:MAG TPA: alpha/beta hydrolase, partial [Nitrososphaeraceae archaeon]|nr:alpha/beta hydrolase [Nitrososphaeraceae archaeon]
KSDFKKKRSRLWYLLPIFLLIIGGLIAYFMLRESNHTIARNSLWLGIILSTVATTLALAVYLAYVSDMAAARERISTAQVINTAYGPIQYADVGRGAPVLMIHGAGGGFDQGLFTAKGALGEDNIPDNYRIIAPSRFGYLGTPMPSDGDASPAAAADAHAALLDVLDIHDKVVVIGTSAGALSSMQFAMKYPDRVLALVLEVPDSWKPPITTDGSQTEEQLMANDFIMNTVLKSDFIMWTFTKVAKGQMVSFLGATSELQKTMTTDEQKQVDELMNMIFPVSERQAGIVNDGINHQKLERYPLENIRAPTLVIDAKDVSTFPGSKYTAENISNAKLVAFETGGHMLIGHGDDTRNAINEFLKQHQQIDTTAIRSQ